VKVVPIALATHTASGSTTLATCWKVTRSDAQVFGFTDHDRDLVVSGVTYRATSGYTRTAVQDGSALGVDNLDLEGVFDDDAITELDLRAGLWDYASVEIFMVNWVDVTMGTIKIRKGRLGEVKAGRSKYTTELRGLLQNIQQDVGRIYAPSCDADFGDARCGKDVEALRVSGSITTVTSNRTFNDTARSEVNGYFDRGKITFTSGDNNGLSMEIKQYQLSGTAFALQLPMPYTLQVGDTYTMIPGCGKDIQVDCLLRWNNVVNFRGVPWVPGTDFMVSGGL
jgi:uncharacterized phage protein (TIGR02218 family)